MVWANPGCFCIILMEGLECGESGEEWDGVGVFFWLPLGPWISTQECLNGIIYLFQECARKFLLPLSPIEHLAVRQKKKRLSAEILSCAFIQIAKTANVIISFSNVLQNSSPKNFRPKEVQDVQILIMQIIMFKQCVIKTHQCIWT